MTAPVAVRAVRLSDGTIVAASALEEFEHYLEICGRVDQALGRLSRKAQMEDWCRGRVAAAGRDWATHFVKFDGTVLPR